MDPSQCPPGFYTDRAFQRAPLDECATPIWVYWLTTMGVGLFRLISLFKKFDNYFRYNATSATPKKPTSLFTHTFAATMYILVFILVGANVANVDNGVSFSIYSLAYLSFIINYSILLWRTVRLGRRLIPKHSEHVQAGDLSFLSRFNALGVAMIITQSVSAAVSCLALVVFSPIYPEKDIELGMLGFITKGVFQMLCILGIVMQFQRCIQALSSYRSGESVTPTLTERETQLSTTIRIMRQRQLIILVIGVGVSILFILLGALVLPWTWPWVILGTAGPETIGSFALEMFFTGNKKPSTVQSAAVRQQPSGRREGENALVAQAQDEDELRDLPSAEVYSNEEPRPKVGPIGRRFRRKPKPVIDLTKVTEEATYFSTNPVGTITLEPLSMSGNTNKEETV